MAGAETEIIKNDQAQQFEMHVDGHIAKLAFHQSGKTITYPHTEVPQAIAGRGIAGKLAKHALDYARENGLRVIAQCPYVNRYVREHPEYQDLVD